MTVPLPDLHPDFDAFMDEQAKACLEQYAKLGSIAGVRLPPTATRALRRLQEREVEEVKSKLRAGVPKRPSRTANQL